MSDDLTVNSDQINPAAEPMADEEFEEISSDEVDRIVAFLDELIETVQSENIQAILEDASNSIFSLVYDENDLEEMQDEAA
jgi:hypothetical protein